MQDMRDLYKAYAAVHDTTIKEELDNSKDQITEMNLSQMTEGDLVEVCEEIVEGLFQYGLDLDGAYGVVGDILEAASDNIIGDRKNKIVSIAEAFEKVFETVTDKAERNCEEAFLLYRKQKPLTEKWNNKVSHETGNAKIHAAIIHEDREGVKSGLIEMISEKLDKVGKEDADVDNDGDVDSSDSYLKKRRSAIGKAMGKNGKKEKVEELYKGKHGQSEKDYQDSRSDAGKMVSGDSKGSGANYSYRAKNTGSNPAGGSQKPQGQARMSSKDRSYLAYQKANMKKEEVVNEALPALIPAAGAALAKGAMVAGKLAMGAGKVAAKGAAAGGKAIGKGAAMGAQQGAQDRVRKMVAGKDNQQESVFSQAELDRIEEIVNSWED